MKNFLFIKSVLPGILLVSLIALIATYLSRMSFMVDNHLSVLTIGIIIGALLSPLYNSKYHVIKARKYHSLKPGINLLSKKALRVGIVFYGFNVSLLQLGEVGARGVLIACIIVFSIFVLGLGFGRLLKMDKELSMLVAIGNAVCGAAAILALEAMLKTKSNKTIIAVGTIIIFGIFSMFAVPFLLNVFRVPLGLSYEQIGVMLGATMQEVANVVVAGANVITPNAHIAKEVASLAIIEKMIRVILLVPALLAISYLLSKSTKNDAQSKIDSTTLGEGTKTKQTKRKITIPYFAIYFLIVIVINTLLQAYLYPAYPDLALITQYGAAFSKAMLLLSMSALGLQIAIDAGIFRAFSLASILLVCVCIIAYTLVKLLY